MTYYFKKHQMLTGLYIASAIFAAFMTVGIAFVYQSLANSATQGDLSHFMRLSLLAVGYFVVEAVSDFLPRKTASLLIQTIVESLRNDLTSHYLRESILANQQQKSARRIGHLTNDLDLIETIYLDRLVFSVQVIGVFIFAVLGAFILNGMFATIMIALALVPFLSPFFSKWMLANKREQWQTQKNRYLKQFEEFSSHLAFIKLSHASQSFTRRLKGSNQVTKERAIDFQVSQGLTITIIYALGNIVYSGTWIVGGYFILMNRITLPEVIAMTTLMGTIAGPIQAFSNCYTEITASQPIVTKILALVKPPSKPLNQPQVVLESLGNIHLNQVAFGYQALLFKDLNLIFEKGQRYGITGSSGSGKSTLLDLLLGIREPTTGEIYFGKEELKGINKASLYAKVAYIPQKTAIFEGSIRENISLFQEADDEKMSQALKEVGLEKYALAGEAGLNYQLSAETQLSGGEERRLDIARGLYGEAELLIFDEPTSGVDKLNESLIANIISKIENKIIIVVTHSDNAEFLAMFHHVYRLENQRLVKS